MNSLQSLETGTIDASRLVLGCGTFGGIGTDVELIGRGLTDDAACGTMQEAVALGITVFDTAHGYAGGASETIIGRWLARQRRSVRAAIRIATKVGVVEGGDDFRIDLTPQCIAEQLELSLDRLGIRCVDLCLAHFPDPATPIEETLEGFSSAIAAGRVTSIGLCNANAEQLREAISASKRHGLPRVAYIQNEYNLLRRDDETSVLPMCREFGIRTMCYSPVAGGKLSGKYVPGQPADPNSRLAVWPGSQFPSPIEHSGIQRLRELGAQQGVSPGAMALAWVLAQPHVMTAIVGPARDAEHLRTAREALDVTLDPTTSREIATWFDRQ